MAPTTGIGKRLLSKDARQALDEASMRRNFTPEYYTKIVHYKTACHRTHAAPALRARHPGRLFSIRVKDPGREGLLPAALLPPAPAAPPAALLPSLPLLPSSLRATHTSRLVTQAGREGRGGGPWPY